MVPVIRDVELRALFVGRALALVLSPAGCARTSDTPPDKTASAPQDAAAEEAIGRLPTALTVLAIGAVALVILAVASADKVPHPDYSDICGTPDCS